MHTGIIKSRWHVFSIVIITLVLIYSLSAMAEEARVTTDREVYRAGEPIKVSFSGATGLERDWICIVPADAPDTEGGDYQHMPRDARQGALTFTAGTPGKYQARAYYNYDAKGYVVAARSAFTVESSPEYKKAKADEAVKFERPVNPANPLESRLGKNEGLVYLFRRSSTASNRIETEIKAGDKVVGVMPHSSYLALPVAAGDIRFSTGPLTTYNNQQNKREEVWTVQSGEASLKIKAGYVYYLQLVTSYRGGYGAQLELVPHREGADIIAQDQLTILR